MPEAAKPVVYFYSVGEQRIGPVTGNQLKELAKAGRILPTDTIWQDGKKVGSPAARIKGLFQSAPKVRSTPSEDPVLFKRHLVRPTTRRLFISCVSHEFRSYRDILATNLAQPGVELRRQEDFVNSGRTTLEKLNDYIKTCDAVIHLVGHGTGAYPGPMEVEAILQQHPDFVRRSRFTDPESVSDLSYTQWEAWLAIYHDKPLALYRAADVARREPEFCRDDQQRAKQDQHWKRLIDLGRDRREFVSPHDLSIEVLRALPQLVPGFQDNIRIGESRDRNLLFAILALEDEIVTRESFVLACKLWANDVGLSIGELMIREKLISDDDRALVEARVERRLKARGGDVRQSLADCLEIDVRQSLSESLDPQSLASLPSQFFGSDGPGTSSTNWRYRITRTHGVGGLGVVSEAEDSGLERNVAIKQLKAERLLEPMAIERFIREAKITGRLQHPNIIPVYEMGLTPGDQIPFYAMRFVGHRTLQSAIVQHYMEKDLDLTERNLRFRMLIQAFLAVCNAVAYAHEQNVIHRDIKPANIMLGDFGEVILLDWGLAKKIGEQELPDVVVSDGSGGPSDEVSKTKLGARLGSPAYMAPEQASGRIDDHSQLTDVYGLGVTLYEILTGDVPFSGATTDELYGSILQRRPSSPRSRNPSVSASLSAICLKAISKAQSDRYPSARDLADDIQHWLADEPVVAYREWLPSRLLRFARRHPGSVSAFAATVLVGVLGLSIGLLVVNAERGKAVAAREEAENNFDLARESVNSIAIAISGDDLSVIPGVQDLRAGIAKKAKQQNELLVASRPDSLEVLAELGTSRLNYAQVLLSVGPVEDAVAEAVKGIAEIEQAVRQDKSQEMRLRLAEALVNIASIYWDLSDTEAASPHLDRAIGMLEVLHNELPTDTNVTFKLAQCLNIRGNCWVEPEMRTAAYDRSRSLSSSILTTHPRTAEAYQVYAAATFNIAMRYWRKSERNTKLELLRQAGEADKRVLSMTPNAPKAVSNSSFAMEEIGALLADLNQNDEARATFESAESLARNVIQQNPRVTRFQWLLASTLKRKAEFHTKLGEFEKSRQYYDEASSVLQSLVDRVDDRPQYAVTWIEVRSAIATFSQGLPEAGGSRDNDAWKSDLETTVATAERCVERFPYSIELKYQLGMSLFQRSNLFVELGKWDLVEQDMNRACGIYESELADRTRPIDDPKLISYIGWLQQLQSAVSRRKDAKATKGVFEKASRLADRVYDPEAAQTLGTIMGEWGKYCSEQGDTKAAIEAYEMELRVSNGPFMRVPWNWYLRSNLATAHINLAKLYEKTGDTEKEVRSRQQWLRIWGAYFHGLKTESYLDPDPPPTLAEAKRLRAITGNDLELSRIAITCDLGGRKYPITVYISNCRWPQDPLEDQARWLEELRGIMIPENTRETFRLLHKTAHENNASFRDVVYLLIRTNKQNKLEVTLHDTPAPIDLSYAVSELKKCAEKHNVSVSALMQYSASLSESSVRDRADNAVTQMRKVDVWLGQQGTAIDFQDNREKDLERLLLIAAENGVSFHDLTFYALGARISSGDAKLTEADKQLSSSLATYEKDQSPECAKLCVESYSRKADVLIELKRYSEAVVALQEAIAVCESLFLFGNGGGWIAAESEKLRIRVKELTSEHGL